MERAVSFEEPQVILEIPRPFSDHGQTHVGSSCAITSRRKRRRPDVALGIDGAAFNLYSVKKPRLVASHPIPPETTFTASPVFAHTKGNSRNHPRRFSYAAVRGGVGSPRYRILCYHEKINLETGAALLSDNNVGEESKIMGQEGDEVVFIDVIPAYRKIEDSSAPFDLISVTRSGQIVCLSGDLTSERWSGSLHGHAELDGRCLRYASMHDAASLLEGFLGAHPEVTAQIQPGVDDESDVLRETHLLVTVSSATGSAVAEAGLTRHDLQVFVVGRPESGALTRSPLHRLGSWPIDVHAEPGALCNFSLDVKKGHLNIMSAGQLTVFDLNQATPSKACQFRSGDGNFVSTTRIGGSLLVASAQQDCSVYDMTHGSILARAETWRPNRSLKRKRGESGHVSGPLRILRFEAGRTTLYGLSSNEIFSIKLNMQRQSSRSGHAAFGRFADSLGQAAAAPGSEAARKPDGRGASVDVEEAKAIMQELDAVMENVDQFDAQFNAIVVENTELSNVAMQQLANYAIVKIFAWTSRETKKNLTSPARLRVACMPREAFHWLTFKGFITPQNVEHALCQHAQKSSSLPVVSAQTLVESMAQVDPSLVLLSAWIELQPHPELNAFVQALKHLLESFDADEQVEQDKLLTNGKDVEDGEDMMMVEAEESAAERDLEAASALLEDGMQIRAGAIKTCLSRLSKSFHQSALSQSFKANMSQRDVVLLIDLLRVELSEDGWTSHLLDLEEGEEEEERSAVSSDGLPAACSLLNGAVDALGSGGLLAGSYGIGDEHDSAEGFLGAVRQEMSSIIESIQEATFFSEFLKDFLRFRNALQTREGKTAQSKLAEESMLPLGVKSVRPISSTRTSAGGQIQRRTARDVGHKLSQRLGPYTFESIQL